MEEIHQEILKVLGHPLKMTESEIFFMTSKGKVIAFDRIRENFFEPNLNVRYTLVDNMIGQYIDQTVKANLTEKFGTHFENLTELTVKANYKEKYFAKKFFYSKTNKRVYTFDFIKKVWLSDEQSILRQYFNNNDIIDDEDESASSKPKDSLGADKYRSLEELDIHENELQELDIRFRDASVHYYHKKRNCIYSRSFAGNYWYIPPSNIQTQLLHYVDKLDESDDNISDTEIDGIDQEANDAN
jgi:hypothetical protein